MSFPLDFLTTRKRVDSSRTAVVLNSEWNACTLNPNSSTPCFHSETASQPNSRAFLEPHRYYRRIFPHYSVSKALAAQITQVIDCSVVLTWVTSPGFPFDGALTGFNQDAAQILPPVRYWYNHRKRPTIDIFTDLVFFFFKQLANYALFKYFRILLSSAYSVVQ